MPRLPPRSRAATLAACALFALAFGLRLARGGEPLTGPLVRVSDPDATYHLRRAERIRDGFPTLALVDPFLNAPAGAVVPWPPLWDLALASALRIAPSDEATGAVRAGVAALPPLVAALAALAVFALARRLWPERLDLALAAAGVGALVAADRPWTGFGRLDHSAAELAAWCAIGAVLAHALCREAEAGARWDRRALLPATALALGLSIQAALLPAAALPALALALLPAARRAGAARFLATVWGGAALLLLPAAALYAAAGSPFAHTRFGLFQPALLAAAAALAAGVHLWTGGRRPLAALALAAALAGGGLLAPEVARGLGFVGRGPAWIATVGESRSPLAGPVRESIGRALAELSPLVLLLPVGLVLLARRARRGDGAAAAASALLAVATLLAAAQARFAGHLGLPLGIAATAALAPALARLRAPAARVLAVAGLMAAVVLPQRLAARPVEVSARALARSFDLLLGLRERARGSAETARGVVLAEWSFGHYVQYYGRHPAAVDNFGDWLADLSLPRRVLLAESEAEAEALLERAGVRYLLVGELAETLSGLLPGEAERARLVAASRLRPEGRLAIEFRPAIVGTVLYRAARQLGSAALSPGGELVPPLRGLRLVDESGEGETLDDGRELPWFKLYERVPGARLVLRGLEPGSEVALEAELASPRGRFFPWLDVVRAGADGVAELRFPYSTGAARGARPLALRVRAAGRELDLREIPERAVREGLALELAADGAPVSRAGSRGRG